MDIKEFVRNINRTNLSEDEVKDILKLAGIKTTNYTVASSGEDVDAVENYPVVMKVCSPDILQKTDVGGVKLNIKSKDEAKAVFAEMQTKFPNEKVLIEPMEKTGVELIMGLIRDPTFGLSIMVGLGGIFTEVFEDVAFRVIPITRKDAENMLSELKGKKLLEGFRGMNVNKGAIVDMLMKLSVLADTLGDDLSQMDLNPVFARDNDAIAVDAKMILNK